MGGGGSGTKEGKKGEGKRQLRRGEEDVKTAFEFQGKKKVKEKGERKKLNKLSRLLVSLMDL